MTPTKKKQAIKLIDDAISECVSERSGTLTKSKEWFQDLRDLISPPKDATKTLQKDLNDAKRRISELEKKLATKVLTQEEAKAKEIRDANFREP